MPVELQNNQRRLRGETGRIKKAGEALLAAVNRSGVVLSILLTDDRAMRRLHSRWMGDPRPTDVLSFPAHERVRRPHTHSCARRFADSLILGDIAISVETAVHRNPKNPLEEVLDCLIHGLLHLVGFDHVRLQERQRMNRQARRLRKVVSGALDGAKSA